MNSVPWDILYFHRKRKDWYWLTTMPAKTPEEALKKVKKLWWPRQSDEHKAEYNGVKIRARYPDMPNRKVAYLGERKEQPKMKITKTQLTEMIREAVNEQLETSHQTAYLLYDKATKTAYAIYTDKKLLKQAIQQARENDTRLDYLAFTLDPDEVTSNDAVVRLDL